MYKNLTKEQLKIVKDSLIRIRDMEEHELTPYRDFVSTSLVCDEVKELIIEGVDSRLNRDDRVDVAIAAESELKICASK